MRKLLPYKKGKRKSGDLKIPIPLVGGIENAKLTEWQLDALLTSGQRHLETTETSAGDGDGKRGARKAGSTISTIEPRPQATLPARPISSPPVLAMPYPRRPLPPGDSVLRREELDKTELESRTSDHQRDDGGDDVVVLWPQNWMEVPNYIQQEQIRAAAAGGRGGTGVNDPWASSSEDSTRQYTSAPQSPLVSDDQQPSDLSLNRLSSTDNHSTPRAQHRPPPIPQPRPATEERQQQPRRPILVVQHHQHESISLEDLKRQVDMIQLQRVKERHEWERREMEHRQREKEMLDKIQDTQRRLERALASNSSSGINNDQNGISNSTTTTTNNANEIPFPRRRYVTREQPTQQQQQNDEEDGGDGVDPPSRYHHYYYYYPDAQQHQRPRPRPRPRRRSSAPGSPQEGDYHSAMEEVMDGTQHQDDDEEEEEPAMARPRRSRRSYMAEDVLPYATFPSHAHRPPPPHTLMAAATAAMRGRGRGIPPPPPHLMYDDWAAWPPQPFLHHNRHRRFGPSTTTATTPSIAYPESYQDEYLPYRYPFLRQPPPSGRTHHRATAAAPVPMFHHHRPMDGPPPPSMGYH